MNVKKNFLKIMAIIVYSFALSSLSSSPAAVASNMKPSNFFYSLEVVAKKDGSTFRIGDGRMEAWLCNRTDGHDCRKAPTQAIAPETVTSDYIDASSLKKAKSIEVRYAAYEVNAPSWEIQSITLVGMQDQKVKMTTKEPIVTDPRTSLTPCGHLVFPVTMVKQ